LAFDGSLDVSGSQIIWTATVSTKYAAGAFNGFNLEFTGAPTITDVSLDPASTILPVPFAGPPVSSLSGFSFNGSNVLFNIAGDSVTAGQQLILDVQTGPSAVPEPANQLLLGSGLIIGVAFLRRRKFTAAIQKRPQGGQIIARCQAKVQMDPSVPSIRTPPQSTNPNKNAAERFRTRFPALVRVHGGGRVEGIHRLWQSAAG
jgi:hypothetical protein